MDLPASPQRSVGLSSESGFEPEPDPAPSPMIFPRDVQAGARSLMRGELSTLLSRPMTNPNRTGEGATLTDQFRIPRISRQGYILRLVPVVRNPQVCSVPAWHDRIRSPRLPAG